MVPDTSVNLVDPSSADCKVIFDVIKGVCPELVAETVADAFFDEVALNDAVHVIIDCGSAVLSGGIAAKTALDEKALASSNTKTILVINFFLLIVIFSFFIKNLYLDVNLNILGIIIYTNFSKLKTNYGNTKERYGYTEFRTSTQA